MSDYFDPSPRALKRRRTVTSRTAESGSEEQENVRQTQQMVANKAHDKSEDSAYGSKEDSLVEDEDNAIPDEPKKLNTVHARNHTRGGLPAQRQSGNNAEGTSNTVGTPVDLEDENSEDVTALQPRSSGRERRKPRRFSLSPEPSKPTKPVSAPKPKKPNSKTTSEQETATTEQVTPKGILTPSKKGKRSGPRKSVLFTHSEKEIEQQFGFKDIIRSVKKSPKAIVVDAEVRSQEFTTSPQTPSKRSRTRPTVSPLPDPEPAEELEDEFEIIASDLIGDNFGPVEIDLDGNGSCTTVINDDSSLLALKTIVLERLVGRTCSSLPVHLQSQYDTLYPLLCATIVSGESNSMLLLGARGSGKSHLLELAISDLRLKFANDFHTVRLNGFYQTDDRLALREIWRQLGREMHVEEMETGEIGGSYADTMSSLLSLLSHPDEFDDGPETSNHGNSSRTSKSIVFVLGEFDLFTTHPRQTLLYNLFDIAQSKKAPIAVIGCSTRVDVVDCLEKRVKSRFSHRWLHIPSVKTLDGFMNIVTTVLTVEEKHTTGTGLFSKSMQKRKLWNENIQSVFLQDPEIQDLIKHNFYTTKSLADLFTALYIPIATLNIENPSLDTAATSTSKFLVSEPTLPAVLLFLPTIQLSLLISASRLDTIHNLTTVNFNLVYAHYVELISRSKLQVTASGAVAVGAALRQWSREIAQSAWQDLASYECIVSVSGGTGAGNRDNGSVGIDSAGAEGASVHMWRVEVTLEELEWSIKQRWKESGGTRDILVKWCKEI